MLEQPSRGFGEVVVLFNSDEERGSLGSKQLIRLLAAEADYVLSFEPSDSPQEALPLSTSGIATVTATVRGRAAHAGTAPESGINALVEAADLVLRTSHLDDLAQGLRFHWTRLQVGSVTNMIPDQAVAQADLRYTNPAELALARQHLEQAAAKRLVPDSMVDIQIDSGRPAFRADPPSRRLAALAVDIYREAGGQLQLSPGTGGGTDIAYASQAGPAVLESLGLPGGGIHSVGREFADLSAVPRRLYLTVRLLGVLAGPPAATRGPDQ